MIPLTAQAEIFLKDDLGRTIHLAAPAQKIVALYGAYNEILAAMGLEDRIVARTKADTLPPAITFLPSIGTHMRPNIELIVGMGPDLVLQMGGRDEAIQTVYDLERFGITTAFFRVSSFEDLFRVVEKIGLLTGEMTRADNLVRSMHERLNKISMATSMSNDRPSVFFEVRSPDLLTVAKGAMVTDIIEKAGGINCINGDGKLVRINEEEVLRLSPAVYLMQKGPMNPSAVKPENRAHLKTLPAVINHRVYEVDEQLYSRPGPRNVDAVEELAKILHPEFFE